MERVIEAFRNMAASGLLVPDPLCENAIISFLFPLSSLSFVLWMTQIGGAEALTPMGL
jgi:hypothetical protein